MSGSDSQNYVVLCLQLCTNLRRKGTAQPHVSLSLSCAHPQENSSKAKSVDLVRVPVWLR